jgi:hypothetical protein
MIPLGPYVHDLPVLYPCCKPIPTIERDAADKQCPSILFASMDWVARRFGFEPLVLFLTNCKGLVKIYL